jgi:hypothetical protein
MQFALRRLDHVKSRDAVRSLHDRSGAKIIVSGQ